MISKKKILSMAGAMLAVSLVVAPAQSVEMFKNAGWSGWAFDTHGCYNVSWLGPEFNDQVTSIRSWNESWRFYDNINYGGDYFYNNRRDYSSLVGVTDSLTRWGDWNDAISSMQCV